MAIVFIIGAMYCLILAIRRFSGGRVPYYVEKEPDITEEQKKNWSRYNGYSLLFWAGFALFFATEMILDMWPFYIPMGLCAAGGVYMALRGSMELHKPGETGKTNPARRNAQQNKKTQHKKKKK